MNTYLILGATGKTARRVIPHLVEAGHAVRAAARNPGPASRGVEPIRFDWDDPSTHEAALRGADAVYIVPPALRLDFAPHVRAFVAKAEAAGVGSLVLLSARGVAENPESALAQAEAAVLGGVLAGTVVRPSTFIQNFVEGFFRPGLDAGQLVVPTADGATPLVDTEDIAAVAAAALLDPARHEGRVYELSGPRALSFGEAAELMSAHLGRPIEHVDPGLEAWRDDLIGAGLPADYMHMLTALFGSIRSGQDAAPSPGVREALGREATSFEDWLAREGDVLRTPVAA